LQPHMRMRRDVNRSIWRQTTLVPCDRQNTRPDGPSTSRRQRSSNAQFPHLRFSALVDSNIVVSHDPTFLSASTQRFVRSDHWLTRRRRPVTCDPILLITTWRRERDRPSSRRGRPRATVRSVGIICHERPNRSFSQPHGLGSPPSPRADQ